MLNLMGLLGDNMIDKFRLKKLFHIKNRLVPLIIIISDASISGETNMKPMKMVLQAILEKFPSLGKAPTIDELSEMLKTLNITEISNALDELEREDAIFRDKKNGKIIAAYPYSSIRTQHRVTFVDGTKVWAMCAIDALGIHFMTGRDITIESVSPLSDLPIKIRLEKGQIAYVDPPEVIVWNTEKGPDEIHYAITSCLCTNFFSSGEILKEWRQHTEGIKGTALSLPDAIKQSKKSFGDLLKK
jgi:DNA-binding transcriptional regulator YhcF (GntR family)